MESFKKFLNQIIPITNEEFENTILHFKNKTVLKNSYFIEQGKVCHQVAFIKKGTLRTFYLNENAEEITSCFCIENNLTTSYKSFILQEPSTLIIQALEDTELLVIDYDDLQQLYKESLVWQTIGRAIAEKQYIVMEQYASVLCNETAKEKYLRLLKEQPSILHKATITDIASYLGITRRTLSRIRKEITL
ncbi:Crp/Fnr family transcriptional regulator [Flavobacterium sp. ZE23DGlu08]|jgi:CRP-like cAMP-binding protein|uniref:Crp/Fnr family transcriptional regulator n=1 Tax=Flavobacterium sp. ZE23DGlu08 TaxID=3059026 RepID=UPI00266041A9|nr:Crp/Fnr family transcriptional regulator [Flavobacterium sp. ZE23DGlu08]WKL44306.1 Crp/Fnr family transcriptional regulator [Flavobacterium sp. ZE23DGlu08]